MGTRYRYERLKPEYATYWDGMTVKQQTEAKAAARKIIAGKARYRVVEAETGVPWFVIGLLHMRESSCRFDKWLHNGDPMFDKAGHPIRTVRVPANCPPDPTVTWEEGAVHALRKDGLDQIPDWCPERVAYMSEAFNGFGYRHPARNIPSPYLWGGTSVQKRGKFVKDGPEGWDPTKWDAQLGTMAVLRVIMMLDADAEFPGATEPEPEQEQIPVPRPRPPVETEDLPPPQSPKANDTEGGVKPLTKSRTLWGAFVGYIGSVGSAIVSFIDRIDDNPYMLVAFLAVLLLASIGLYLVLSGRVNVQKVIAHLSDEE